MGAPCCVVGIDPGLGGGLACLALDGVTLAAIRMPVRPGSPLTVDGPASSPGALPSEA